MAWVRQRTQIQTQALSLIIPQIPLSLESLLWLCFQQKHVDLLRKGEAELVLQAFHQIAEGCLQLNTEKLKALLALIVPKKKVYLLQSLLDARSDQYCFRKAPYCVLQQLVFHPFVTQKSLRVFWIVVWTLHVVPQVYFEVDVSETHFVW